MHYDYFIGMIKNHETDRVKAYCGRSQSTLERIPSGFGLLLPEIITILNNNIDKLCPPGKGIVLFGLQPATMMIASNEPVSLNRYLKDYTPDYHFCCTLEYMVVDLDEIENFTAWEQTHSVIVDFTSGRIMDAAEYMSLLQADLYAEGDSGQVYGKMNAYSLSLAWAIVQIKQGEPSTKPLLTQTRPINPRVLEARMA
jgi:hypothetical protein